MSRLPARRWSLIPDEADPAEQRITPLIRIIAWGCRLAVRAVFRLRLEGLDRLPTHGPAILAPNHASNADPVLIGPWATGALGRRIHWFAKREVLGWPVLGWIGRAGGIHGIERGAADIEGFRTALTVLEADGVLLLFPEGTRSPDGRLQSARDGLAALALRAGATIVPIGIAGSHRAWPKGGRPRLGSRVRVVIGEPFRPADVLPAGTDGRAARAALTRVTMTRIASLIPPEQRGAYADAPGNPAATPAAGGAPVARSSTDGSAG